VETATLFATRPFAREFKDSKKEEDEEEEKRKKEDAYLRGYT